MLSEKVSVSKQTAGVWGRLQSGESRAGAGCTGICMAKSANGVVGCTGPGTFQLSESEALWSWGSACALMERSK